MITRTEQGTVAVLRLDHGKVNALDTELLRQLTATLEEEASSDARAVVLTGTGSCLSAGVDLFRILDGGPEYVAEFFPALVTCLEQLAFFQKPLVVAANGHAIAGGCVMLCAGDWRLVAEGQGRIGLTELPVGVPFPGIAFEIVRAAVPHNHLRELIYRGSTYSVDRALAMGLCDEIVSSDALLERACAVATEFGNIPARTFQTAKEQITEPIRSWARRHADVLEQWTSRNVHDAIRRFADLKLV